MRAHLSPASLRTDRQEEGRGTAGCLIVRGDLGRRRRGRRRRKKEEMMMKRRRMRRPE